jgi:ATP synthase protein I
MQEDKDKKSSYVRQIGLLGSIPMLMAAGPLVAYFIGNWIDNWLDTKPWFTALFLILGFVAVGKEIYNIVRKVNKDL